MRISFRAIGLLLVVATALTSTPTPAQAQDDVVILGADRVGVARCDAVHVTNRLAELFTAISNGGSVSDVADEYFGRATRAQFVWFSVNSARVSGHEHFAGYTWDDVEGYLRERYAQNERLELLGIEFTRVNSTGVNFGPIEVVRRADDLPEPYYKLSGKGVYNCDAQAFVVLSLGTALNEVEFRSRFGFPF